MNYVLRRVKVSRYIQKHQAAKLLPNWQLMDVLSCLKLSNAFTAFTHSYCILYLGHLQQKEFTSRKLVQGSNLNCRSVSRLETERLVTLRRMSGVLRGKIWDCSMVTPDKQLEIHNHCGIIEGFVESLRFENTKSAVWRMGLRKGSPGLSKISITLSTH